MHGTHHSLITPITHKRPQQPKGTSQGPHTDRHNEASYWREQKQGPDTCQSCPIRDPGTKGHTGWAFTEQVNPEAKGFAGAQEYGWGGWLMGAVSGVRERCGIRQW